MVKRVVITVVVGKFAPHYRGYTETQSYTDIVNDTLENAVIKHASRLVAYANLFLLIEEAIVSVTVAYEDPTS